MATPQAIIQALEGEVSVTRNGAVVNIKAGDFLLPGDQVQTGADGRINLEFPGLEGQTPAAGVMSPNGTITLGEQLGSNGAQLVVIEDTECFEFTTEITDESAAASSGGGGLFGAGFAGGGALTAGAGAVAAGAFLGGGSGGGSEGGDASVGSAGTGDNGGTGFVPGSFSSDPTTDPEGFIEEVIEKVENTAEDPEGSSDDLLTQLTEAGTDQATDPVLDTLSSGPVQQTVDLVDEAVEPIPELDPVIEVADQVAEPVDATLAEVATGVGEVLDQVSGAIDETGLMDQLADGQAELEGVVSELQAAAPESSSGDSPDPEAELAALQESVEGTIEGLDSTGDGTPDEGGILGTVENLAANAPSPDGGGDELQSLTGDLSGIASNAGLDSGAVDPSNLDTGGLG